MTSEYWDKESGLLKARTYERDGNMLLRTAYFKLFGGTPPYGMFQVNKSLSAMFDDGKWYQHPFTKVDKGSHDEVTSAFYFSSLNNASQDYYIKHTDIWRYAHQAQVFFFLLACKYKWKWARNVAYAIMYESTSDRKKAKNGKWDTDGALLSLLKIKTFENLGINDTWKDREIKFNIKAVWGEEKALIEEMLSDEPLHPLMELIHGQ